MHNAAIAALGLHYVYIPYSVQPDALGPALQSIISLGIIGVNLTIPHKERALSFLDEVAPEAQAVGAVNTVHNDGGRLVGYNTDGEGFLRPLLKRGFELRDKLAVVLGAGGAARSAAHVLASEGATIVLVNRTRERAVRLAEKANRQCGRKGVKWVDLEDEAGLTGHLAGADLLVNTTPVGMSPNLGEAPPIPLAAIHAGLLVYDLIYNPVETELLRRARAVGAQTLNGVGMLVHQGAAAFKIWTGVEPPVDVMERAVLEGLLDH